MNVLVTGGLGFVGSAVARALVTRGERVTLLDSRLAGHGANDRNIADFKDGLVRLCEDELLNRDLLSELVRECDAVVHAAAHVSHTAGVTQPSLDVETNIAGTVALAQALVENRPKAQLIFLSTRGVYGAPTTLPVDEDHPCTPLGPHEWSKLAGEQFLELWSRLHGLRSTVLRLTNVYGPGSQIRTHQFGVINWFIGLAVQGKEVPVFGDGRVRRDLIFIDDAVDAVVRALEPTNDAFRRFNVGNSSAPSLLEIAEAIVREAGSGKITLKPYSAARRKMEVGDFVSDTRKISAALGWVPTTTLAAGLQRSIRYYRTFLSDYL